MYLPSGNSVVGVNVHVPSGLTVAGPDATGLFAASLITTSTVAPGSVVPVTSGVVSFVGLSSSIAIAGGTVSTTKSSFACAVLPAASVASATTFCGPSAKSSDGVNVQVPSALTVAGPETSLPFTSVTVTTTLVPTSVLPVSVGVASFVRSIASTDTPIGAVVSTTNSVGAFAVAWLVALSVAVASTVYLPSGNAVVGVNVHVPSGLTVAGPCATDAPVASLITTLTVASGSVLPVISGVVSLVGFDSSIEIGGGVVSTITPATSGTGVMLPAKSRAMASTVYLPSTKLFGVNDHVPSAFGLTVAD